MDGRATWYSKVPSEDQINHTANAGVQRKVGFQYIRERKEADTVSLTR